MVYSYKIDLKTVKGNLDIGLILMNVMMYSKHFETLKIL